MQVFKEQKTTYPKKDFLAIAAQQRGEPERAMLLVQKVMGGGVLNPVVEHAGDLMHRMNEWATWDNAGYLYVKQKVAILFRYLTDPYGFLKEFDGNVTSNARLWGMDRGVLYGLVKDALTDYRIAHAKLPEYNEAHTQVKKLTYAISALDVDAAVDALLELRSHLKSPEEWKAYAHKNCFDLEGSETLFQEGVDSEHLISSWKDELKAYYSAMDNHDYNKAAELEDRLSLLITQLPKVIWFSQEKRFYYPKLPFGDSSRSYANAKDYLVALEDVDEDELISTHEFFGSDSPPMTKAKIKSVWDQKISRSGRFRECGLGEDKNSGNVFNKALYHVTFTAYVDKIKRSGIRPMSSPSNWVKAGSKKRYGEGDIYACDNASDAVRWAAKMDWETFQKMGSEAISIVTFKDDIPWRIDNSDPLSQAGNKGSWLVRSEAVSPEAIISSRKVTSDLIKKLVKDDDTDFDEALKEAVSISEAESGWSLPKPLQKLGYEIGPLSQFKKFKAPVFLSNSDFKAALYKGGEEPPIGELESCYYALVSENSNEVIPVARSDEHQTGYELLQYFVDKYGISDAFISIGAAGTTYIYNINQKKFEQYKNVLQRWHSMGGGSIWIEAAGIRDPWRISSDEFIELENPPVFEKGKISSIGHTIISKIEELSGMAERIYARPELSDKLSERFIKLAASLYNFCDEQGLLWKVEVGPWVRDAVNGFDFCKAEQAVFAFDGIKNAIHMALRKSDKDSYLKSTLKPIFNDVEEARKVFDAMSAKVKVRESSTAVVEESDPLLSKIVRNDDLYNMFISEMGSGPLDGGCYAMARALQNVLGGDLYTLCGIGYKGGEDRDQHIVLKVGNYFYDADGRSSEKQLLKRWEKLEDVENPYLRPYIDGDCDESPRSETFISKVTEYLTEDRSFKHWLSFDSIYLDKVKAAIESGSGFVLNRIYMHPSRPHLNILEIESGDDYQNLDLDVNSLTSPIRYLHRKPSGLTSGLPVERWESIYGSIGRPEESRLEEGFEGPPIWVDELEDAGGKIDDGGNIFVYHGTSPEKAAKIYKEKILRRPSDAPDSYGVYFAAGNKAKEFVAESYGSTVVPMKVRAKDLRIEDFASGRWVTFYAETRGGVYRPVWVGKPQEVVIEKTWSSPGVRMKWYKVGLTEGGLGGHINHLYEDSSLTFGELKELINLVTSGDLSYTEKIDGINIFLSYDVDNGRPLFARNKKDLGYYGATEADIDRYEDGHQMKGPLKNALSRFHTIFRDKEEGELDKIFGSSRTGSRTFYNIEILDPGFENVIRYDSPGLVIHRTGSITMDSDGNKFSVRDDRLDYLAEVIKDIDGIRINEPHILESDSELEAAGREAVEEIDNLTEKAWLTDESTIGDYIRYRISSGIDVAGKSSAQVKKMALKPLEGIVHKFSVEVLSGIESGLVSNIPAEKERLKNALGSTLRHLPNSGGDTSSTIVNANAEKMLGNPEISTAEGIVFKDGEGRVFKLTGNFAPMNQIMGINRFGRGEDEGMFEEVSDYTPQKTITAYKLFRTVRGQPGKIFPLFIGKNDPVPIGRWIVARADYKRPEGFAERPGWHVGKLPLAPHLMSKAGGMMPGRVWAEVEIPADVDWQPEAEKSKTKDIKGKIPEGGYYIFKRPFKQGGEWLIGGAIKVNRILTQDEVDEINKKLGVVAEGLEVKDKDKGKTIVALVPGSFKPPHRGQWEMVKYYCGVADACYVIISDPKEAIRKSPEGKHITAEQAQRIFEIYAENDGIENVHFLIRTSPVKYVFEYVGSANIGDEIILGVAAKGDDLNRFEGIDKYTPEGVEVYAEPYIPIKMDEGEAVSGTAFRAALDSGEFDEFLPDLSPENKSKVDVILKEERQDGLVRISRIHDELNPELWTDGVLNERVRETLLRIADAWVSYADVPIDSILDIAITGGNCNYNYTDRSDIDLNLFIDYDRVGDPDDLLDKKRLWGNAHDIKIYGIPVEIYPRDSQKATPKSQGVYSLWDREWVSEPTRHQAYIDWDTIMMKVETWADRIDNVIALQTNDLDVFLELKRSLFEMREVGITQGGEYSIENLVFKELRNQGYIDLLLKYIGSLEDRLLSLEQKKPSASGGEDLFESAYFELGPTKDLKQNLKNLYELEYKYSNTKLRPFTGMLERKNKILERMGDLLKEICRAVAKDLAPLYDWWIEYHKSWDEKNLGSEKMRKMFPEVMKNFDNVQKARDVLRGALARKYEPGAAAAFVNWAVNVCHASGPMLDYIEGEFEDVNKEFLDRLSSQDTGQWDRELMEMGVDMGDVQKAYRRSLLSMESIKSMQLTEEEQDILLESEYFSLGATGELVEDLESIYELEYKYSMLMANEFNGVPARKEKIRDRMEGMLKELAVSIASKLYETYNEWLRKHALTNPKKWAEARVGGDDNGGYVDIEQAFSNAVFEAARYGKQDLDYSDIDLKKHETLAEMIEEIKADDRNRREEDLRDEVDREEITEDEMEEKMEEYDNMDLQDFFEEYGMNFGSVYDFILDSVIKNPYFPDYGKDEVVKDIYEYIVFPLWYGHWSAEGIDETRKNIEDAAKKLEEISSGDMNLKTLIGELNHIINISHQTGPMMDYIEEVNPGVDADFLDYLSEMDPREKGWDKELWDMGVALVGYDPGAGAQEK